MPLYEYKCSECGFIFEVLQKVNEHPQTKCPNCGGSVKKVISAPTLQFKGSGWYITDYAQKEKQETKPETEAKPKKDKDSSKEKKSKQLSSDD